MCGDNHFILVGSTIADCAAAARIVCAPPAAVAAAPGGARLVLIVAVAVGGAAAALVATIYACNHNGRVAGAAVARARCANPLPHPHAAVVAAGGDEIAIEGDGCLADLGS
jgi:hypothetical protein